MKFTVCLLALYGAASAQRLMPHTYQNPPYVNEYNYDGSYKYSYETGNGISVQEDGYLWNPSQKDLVARTAKGTYSYTAPDGQVITVHWYADETGFYAECAYIQSVPPRFAWLGRPAGGDTEGYRDEYSGRGGSGGNRGNFPGYYRHGK